MLRQKNVNNRPTDRHTDGQMDNGKTICPLSFNTGA